jgi:hypothetical protein
MEGEGVMRVPVRCALCGDIVPGWHRWFQLWGLCTDCRAWDQWLRQCRAALRKAEQARGREAGDA